jgi:long-chain acyl-CoA synthetase
MIQANSLGDLLRKQAELNPGSLALLTPESGGFREIAYSEFVANVRRYAGALMKLGLGKGDRAAIASDNCVEWVYFDWACSSLGIVSIPIYATLPADQTQYIVCDSGASMFFAGSQEHMDKVRGLQGVCSMLMKGPDSLDALAATSDLTDAALSERIAEIELDDVFTIIYTSGTTGQPKGAMLQHRAALHVCRSAISALQLDASDRFLSFLPMSHVYERIAGQCLPVAMGASIAYAKNLASIASDMQKTQPTIMLCVPRFLESVKDRIEDALKKMPAGRRRLMALAMSQSKARANGKFAPLAAILDKMVLAKARERTGGRLRFFVSGGAALPTHVSEFLNGLNLQVLQGYGLTETSGGTCVNHPDRNRPSTVGEPLDMEIRIAEDGEILVRGPAVMLGYHNLPEDTALAIDSDGWFHTGDIGEMDGRSLRITDRKKDIIVLANGKNVAPQPIENKLRSSAFIEEAVVFGDSMDSCVALIVPRADAVRSHLGLTEDVKLSSSPEAKGLMKKEIDAINKTLAHFEIVKKHAILDEPFSIESGELTPSLKVKRKVVRERYAELLRSMS